MFSRYNGSILYSVSVVMAIEDGISELLKKDKSKPRVTWDKKKPQEFEAGTLCKERQQEEFSKLLDAGYSVKEAASVVGLPFPCPGIDLLNEEIFYETREEIDARRERRGPPVITNTTEKADASMDTKEQLDARRESEVRPVASDSTVGLITSININPSDVFYNRNFFFNVSFVGTVAASVAVAAAVYTKIR